MKKFNKKNILNIVMYSLYTVIFTSVVSILILFYGPYEDTRRVFVNTLLATRHSYLLTDIFSEETLNNMSGKKAFQEDVAIASEKVEQDLSKIEVQCTSGNSIQEYTIEKNKYKAYILEISNPKTVKVAMTKYLGKMGEKTSEMAEDNKAVAAINGGAFQGASSDGTEYAGTGAMPCGFVVSNGKVVYQDCDGNDIKNITAIDGDGKLIVGEYSLNQLLAQNVMEAMCFSTENINTGIVIDGQRMIKSSNRLADGINPRTLIGQKADGTIIFLVIDGRKLTMPGADIYEAQEIMMERGAINVGTLDGGYSSTMYYKGEVINSPNTWNGERSVATAYYVQGQ